MSIIWFIMKYILTFYFFYMVYVTPSVPNYMSFDFFDIKFDYSFYSKNLRKYSQI